MDDQPKYMMCDGCGHHYEIVSLHPSEGDELLCTGCLYETIMDSHPGSALSKDEFKAMLENE